MPLSKETQDAVAHELRKDLPLMDIEKIKKQFLGWLAKLNFPAYPEKETWEDCLNIIPHNEGGKNLESGVKIRLSLTLYTQANKYLLSIMECFDPEARGYYIFTVHTNWDENEKRLLKRIDNQYVKEFDGSLKAKHTVWAQTFSEDKLHEALDAGAVAILSHELIGAPLEKTDGNSIQLPSYSAPAFIEKTDDDNSIL
ncbi:MAG: hypothetical protein KAR42_17500 [candidate division Zixibacteria bacterium]|nr:hypothetical protein [candidate division Zixibacteria bacterium]